MPYETYIGQAYRFMSLNLPRSSSWFRARTISWVELSAVVVLITLMTGSPLERDAVGVMRVTKLLSYATVLGVAGLLANTCRSTHTASPARFLRGLF